MKANKKDEAIITTVETKEEIITGIIERSPKQSKKSGIEIGDKEK